VLELMTFVLEKVDFLELCSAVKNRNNRKAAARLHLILVKSYEFIELYKVILDELKAALESHEKNDATHKFYLNPHRMEILLSSQAKNVETMEVLIGGLLDEVKLLDNKFADAYKRLFPGKAGILFDAEWLLRSGRVPLNESKNIDNFPADEQGVYRTAWITGEKPTEDRKELEKYLYGWDGKDKEVIDVNLHDGNKFFEKLKWYFETQNPYKTLKELSTLTESYKQALVENFKLDEILSDIGKVRQYDNWASPSDAYAYEDEIWTK
jgi:hypothetical protein